LLTIVSPRALVPSVNAFILPSLPRDLPGSLSFLPPIFFLFPQYLESPQADAFSFFLPPFLLFRLPVPTLSSLCPYTVLLAGPPDRSTSVPQADSFPCRYFRPSLLLLGSSLYFSLPVLFECLKRPPFLMFLRSFPLLRFRHTPVDTPPDLLPSFFPPCLVSLMYKMIGCLRAVFLNFFLNQSELRLPPLLDLVNQTSI